MEFYDLIFKRKSIRSYDKNRQVEKEKIEKILNAARMAPSAANKQPWQFMLISSPEILNKVKQCYNKPWFHNAPHVLVVKGIIGEAWKRSYDNYVSIETDLAIAMTYIILAAANEGIATCWISNFDPVVLKETLNLSDNEVVYSITPLGYPENDINIYTNNKERKDLNDIVKFL